MTAPKRPAPKRPVPKCPRAQMAAPRWRRPEVTYPLVGLWEVCPSPHIQVGAWPQIGTKLIYCLRVYIQACFHHWQHSKISPSIWSNTLKWAFISVMSFPDWHSNLTKQGLPPIHILYCLLHRQFNSWVKLSQILIHSFIHSGHFYSAPSSPPLLRGAPDYSTDTVSEFHAEAHRQLQVKDLPKVPTWRLERESNPRPSGWE